MVGRAGKNVCPPLFRLPLGNPRCRYAWFFRLGIHFESNGRSGCLLEVRNQKSEGRGLDRYLTALPAMKYKCGLHVIPLALFSERGRVERGAECCDAFRKFFPRPTHTLPRFVGDDSAGHRQNSFLRKAERLARAEKRAESNRLNPGEKRPRESAFPRATTLRTFRPRC